MHQKIWDKMQWPKRLRTNSYINECIHKILWSTHLTKEMIYKVLLGKEKQGKLVSKISIFSIQKKRHSTKKLHQTSHDLYFKIYQVPSNGSNPGLSSHTNYIHSFNSSTFRVRNHMKSLKSWRQRNGSNQCIFLIMNSTSPARHVLLYIKSKHVSNFDQFASILILNNPLEKKF